MMAGTLAAALPEGPWLVPAQVGLALAVVVSWLCLLFYSGEFDGATQAPSRVIGLSSAPAERRSRLDVLDKVPNRVGRPPGYNDSLPED
jgi:hypothetical protein